MEVRSGYKQTEIGVIPEDWEVKTLSQCVNITSGVSPSKYIFSNEGCAYFKVEQLNNGNKYAEETEYFVETKNTVPRGSIIFPKRGASIFLNKIRILAQESYMDTNLMSLTPSDELNNEYLFYQLSYIGLSKIADTTSIPQINNKHINPLPIPFPPTKSEQTAIATALSDADVLIASLEKLIEKKRAIKQGAMQELLKPKEGWRSVLFIELLTIPITYGVVTAGTFQNSGVPMLRGGDIKGGQINTIDVPLITVDKNLEYSRTILKNDDVVISLVGYPGETAKVKQNFVGANISRAVGLIRLKENVFPDFIVQFLNSPKGRRLVLGPSAGSAQVVVNLKEINKLKLKVPEYNEQTRIATILSDMDAEIAALEQKLAKYKQIKQGMMQELLTGRIRLVKNV